MAKKQNEAPKLEATLLPEPTLEAAPTEVVEAEKIEAAPTEVVEAELSFEERIKAKARERVEAALAASEAAAIENAAYLGIKSGNRVIDEMK